MHRAKTSWLTVTLNPAWDCTLRVKGGLRPGDVHAVRSETTTAGGKGLNVAKVLAGNGQSVTAGGLLGADDAVRFSKAVRSWGIRPEFLTVPGRVRTNLMISYRGGEMKFNRPGYPDVPWDARGMKRYLLAATEGCEVAILSGSLPLRFPDDGYAHMVRWLRAGGVAVVLDSSGSSLLKGAATRPEVIKPNLDELEQLTGRALASDESITAAVRRLARRHEAVVATAGKRGAWFAAGGLLLRAQAPAVRSVDTTGAGDTLLGQFCSDYFPRRRLTLALPRRATAAGAAAVEQAGTRPVSVHRIRELAGKVSVERIAG